MGEIADFLAEINSFVVQFSRYERQANADCNVAEFLIRRALIYLQGVNAFHQRAEAIVTPRESRSRNEEQLFTDLAAVQQHLEALVQQIRLMPCLPQEREDDRGYRPPTRPNPHGAGRPVIEIRRDQLERLRTIGFSWAKIAQLLGVSVRTVYNRRQELDIQGYSDISDADLDRLVTEILNVSDCVGETLVVGSLRHRGVRVQYSRVRSTLMRVDPVGRALRRRNMHFRKAYHVPAPNSLW